MDKLFNQVVSQVSTSKNYKIPTTCYGAGGSKAEMNFNFVGIVGNGTKLQFKEVQGGWTVTLTPAQVMTLVK